MEFLLLQMTALIALDFCGKIYVEYISFLVKTKFTSYLFQ